MKIQKLLVASSFFQFCSLYLPSITGFWSCRRRDAFPSMRTQKLEGIQGSCVFWGGKLFGRLTKSGKDYLVKRGWQTIESGEAYNTESDMNRERLALVWPSKSGPQFDTRDFFAAHIRPYPKEVTDIVDDKLLMAKLLAGQLIAPEFIESPENAKLDSLYFVKHRLGAQGKSVYVCDHNELKEWWSKSRNSQDFLIQEEIPSALDQGRKFVLRSHILICQRDKSPLESYLHKTVIYQQHSSPYSKTSRERSSHISQAGNKHPLSIILDDLGPENPASNSFSKIESCSRKLVDSLSNHLNSVQIGTETTCFALLGSDLMVDQWGNIKICEVNSHPALGWGTMSKVSSTVFEKIVEDTLSILIDGEHAWRNSAYQLLI